MILSPTVLTCLSSCCSFVPLHHLYAQGAFDRRITLMPFLDGLPVQRFHRNLLAAYSDQEVRRLRALPACGRESTRHRRQSLPSLVLATATRPLHLCRCWRSRTWPPGSTCATRCAPAASLASSSAGSRACVSGAERAACLSALSCSSDAVAAAADPSVYVLPSCQTGADKDRPPAAYFDAEYNFTSFDGDANWTTYRPVAAGQAVRMLPVSSSLSARMWGLFQPLPAPCC